MELMDSTFAISCFLILSSTLIFKIFDGLLLSFGIPESVRCHASCHTSCADEGKRLTYILWKWRNTLLSLFHSIVSGTWTLLCFYLDPKMAEDLISRHSPLSVALVSFSIGYFIHDAFHMTLAGPSRSSYELLIHHAVVLLCFSISLFTRNYIGYAAVALIVEVNSVFLHLRQTCQMLGFARSEAPYRVVSLFNLGTFIVFRIFTLAWMTRWLVINQAQIPFIFYTIGSLGMAAMTVINIVLFYRVLYSDFLRKPKPESAKFN